jgi:hypothetical protein
MLLEQKTNVPINLDGAYMTEKYDLDELLANPDIPLTREQFENFDKYMAMTNDDKPSSDVDITNAVKEIAGDMNANGICWWQ